MTRLQRQRCVWLPGWLTDQRLCLGRIDAQQQAALAAIADIIAALTRATADIVTIDVGHECRCGDAYNVLVRHDVHGSSSLAMAYDDDELANRIRSAVEGERGLTEKPMFGGLAFLVHGNMAVSAIEMDGWLRVDAEALQANGELRRWVSHGITYARSLPPK
jgi:hypothetical protein